MPAPTASFALGQPCWADISVSDTEAAAELYERLFHWHAIQSGSAADGYHVFELRDEPIGGLMQARDEGPAAWIVYLATDDLSGTLDAVRRHGGSVEQGPQPRGTAGIGALCADPTGALFGLWQGRDVPGFGLLDEPGSPCWVDLHTRDGQVARDFYAAVFDLEFVEIPGPGNYSTAWSHGFAPANPAQSGALFGLQDIGDQPATTPTWWQPWIEVAAVPAAYALLKQAGAHDLMTPEETPMPFTGMRHIALALAPQGEFVGLLGR